MKNIKLNELLKLILIILLLISFSDVSFGYYQIMKYVLMSTFVWLIISETDSIKKGWRFLFFVLAILFNPFFELKIGKELWKVVDVITIIILFVNIIETLKTNNLINFTKYISSFYLKIKKFSINLQSFYVKTKKFRLPLFGVIFLIWGFFIFKKEAEEKALKIQAQQQADSIEYATFKDDSLWEIEKNAINKRAKALEPIFFTEKNALRNFKEWLKLYYPTWNLKKIVSIKKGENYKFKISCIGYFTKYASLGNDPLVVEINLDAKDSGTFDFYEVDVISGEGIY
jgi:hypothetical protein